MPTARDIIILLAICRYYVLGRAQVQRLRGPDGACLFDCGNSARIARRRLEYLLDEHYINRTRMQVVDLGGTAAPAYYPARRGCELLAEHTGDDRYHAVPTQTPQPHHLPHWLAVTETHLTLDAALAGRTDMRCLGWLNEWDTANPLEAAPEKKFRLYTLLDDVAEARLRTGRGRPPGRGRHVEGVLPGAGPQHLGRPPDRGVEDGRLRRAGRAAAAPASLPRDVARCLRRADGRPRRPAARRAVPRNRREAGRAAVAVRLRAGADAGDDPHRAGLAPLRRPGGAADEAEGRCHVRVSSPLYRPVSAPVHPGLFGPIDISRCSVVACGGARGVCAPLRAPCPHAVHRRPLVPRGPVTLPVGRYAVGARAMPLHPRKMGRRARAGSPTIPPPAFHPGQVVRGDWTHPIGCGFIRSPFDAWTPRSSRLRQFYELAYVPPKRPVRRRRQSPPGLPGPLFDLVVVGLFVGLGVGLLL